MDITKKTMNIEVNVNSDYFTIKNDFSLTSNANLILENLLEDAPKHFDHYLTNLESSQLDLLACDILYNFYAPCYDPDYENTPKKISLFNTSEYYPHNKQKIIGNEVLGNIPNGIYYEINSYSYANNIEIIYHFFYNSDEDDVNKEELHVKMSFQN